MARPLTRKRMGRQVSKRAPNFQEHRHVHTDNFVERKCPECGKTFRRHKRKSSQRMCSMACGKIHDRRIAARRKGKQGIKVIRCDDGFVRVEMVTRTFCQHCGKFFETSGSASATLRHTCSPECRRALRLARSIALSLLYRSVPAFDPVIRDRKCANCRKSFHYTGRGFRIVCSPECKRAWERKKRVYAMMG